MTRIHSTTLAAVALSGALALGTLGARADGPATQPPQTDVQVIALQPASDTTVPTIRPGFSGAFGVPIDAGSVQFLIDGQDVSDSAYVSRTDFMFASTFDLSPQQHNAEIRGKAMNGATFDRQWSFTSSGTANFINNLDPAGPASVGPVFELSGSTLPGSRVRIAAASAPTASGALAAGDNTFTIDTTAGTDGHFSAPITLTSPGPATVRIVSIEPATNAGASATLTLH